MRIGWVRTYTGQHVCLAKPDPSTISLEDIAHHLSMECRWGGATSRHYSVAEHSIWVARFARELVSPEMREAATVAALLHDAHEAYAKDIPTPMKVMLGDGYIEMCAGLDRAIRQALGAPEPPIEIIGAVKQADAHAAWCESMALVARCPSIKLRDGPPEGLMQKVPMTSEIRTPKAQNLIEQSFITYFKFALKQC